jgi:hypothetical protein
MQRAKGSKKKARRNMMIKGRAQIAVIHALKHKEHFDHTGNFIFFATTSGDAWMLDHRENLALKLADNAQEMEYEIKETTKTFSVKWSGEFCIEDGTFFSVEQGKRNALMDYPVDALLGLIEKLKNQQ